tara:strand:+ start:427 stop:537 length:111 start_codon:yes stop_codon:yes gene_type:complete
MAGPEIWRNIPAIYKTGLIYKDDNKDTVGGKPVSGH